MPAPRWEPLLPLPLVLVVLVVAVAFFSAAGPLSCMPLLCSPVPGPRQEEEKERQGAEEEEEAAMDAAAADVSSESGKSFALPCTHASYCE